MTELPYAEWNASVRDGTVLGQRCHDCDAVQGTPKAACPHCGSTELETVELPTEGEVYTETTINVPPSGIDDRGYQVVLVELGDARVMGRIDDGQVDIGDEVAVSGFHEDGEGYVTPSFEPL